MVRPVEQREIERTIGGMDPLRICIAIGPLGLYLAAIGWRNVRRRPRVVSGARDTLALALALAGMVVVGPMELFFPHAAVARYGIFTWLLVLILYGLLLVLLLLFQRPRLVIYNMSVDQLRALLGDVVGGLDPAARWAGDGLALPTLGVQLHIEAFPAMRNVSLVSSGGDQSHAGWRALEAALRRAAASIDLSENPRGFELLTVGLVILAALTVLVARRPHEMLEQLTAAADEVKQIWKAP